MTTARVSARTPISARTAAPDPAVLFGSLSARLRQIVRHGVTAPDEIVEDACQFAWSALLRQGGATRPDATLSWLATTALREALRLLERESRELPLDEVFDVFATSAAPEPHELLEIRERIGAIVSLPQRQQRLLWLHAAGLTYGEIAAHERCTQRAVERHLLRAKRSIRALASE